MSLQQDNTRISHCIYNVIQVVRCHWALHISWFNTCYAAQLFHCASIHTSLHKISLRLSTRRFYDMNDISVEIWAQLAPGKTVLAYHYVIWWIHPGIPDLILTIRDIDASARTGLSVVIRTHNIFLMSRSSHGGETASMFGSKVTNGHRNSEVDRSWTRIDETGAVQSRTESHPATVSVLSDFQLSHVIRYYLR